MSAVSPFFLVGERDGGVVSPSCSRSSSGKEEVLRTERRQRDRVERERGEGDFFLFYIYLLFNGGVDGRVGEGERRNRESHLCHCLCFLLGGIGITFSFLCFLSSKVALSSFPFQDSVSVMLKISYANGDLYRVMG